jgi:hypothetical protein
MDIRPDMIAAASHDKPAPGKLGCNCAACWQVRQLREASPVRREPTKLVVYTLRAIGGVL